MVTDLLLLAMLSAVPGEPSQDRSGGLVPRTGAEHSAGRLTQSDRRQGGTE